MNERVKIMMEKISSKSSIDKLITNRVDCGGAGGVDDNDSNHENDNNVNE